MGSSLFISDLHLSEDTPAIEAGFFGLTADASNLDALYILGDFFEYWVGDDDVSPQIQRIKERLLSLTNNGVPVAFVPGNRDFVLGEGFCGEVGAQLLGDHTVIDLYGTPTLILHGDTLCTDDVEYQKLRVMMRDPAWQEDMLAKPLSERRAFAQHLRAASKARAENDPDNIVDVNPDSVAAAFREQGVAQMIHGHTHRSQHHRHGSCERWVLGDWRPGDGAEVAWADTTGLRLERIPVAPN